MNFVSFWQAAIPRCHPTPSSQCPLRALQEVQLSNIHTLHPQNRICSRNVEPIHQLAKDILPHIPKEYLPKVRLRHRKHILYRTKPLLVILSLDHHLVPLLALKCALFNALQIVNGLLHALQDLGKRLLGVGQADSGARGVDARRHEFCAVGEALHLINQVVHVRV
jgi:hypothetical protein